MISCVAGLGCRADAPLDALREVLAQLCRDHSIDALATLAERADRLVLRDLAREIGLPLIAIERSAIAGIATPTQSSRILADFATGSVAEAVALAALDAPAHIAVTRRISSDGSASAAIALKDLTRDLMRDLP
ncbi:cobalamin biosynthesis protein [Novosphingobium rosa]|uniref:cobalamin biosynthesis protein n=1 Tax=Novosphingobium rosa TaxID=76978 RepID=UPI000AB74A35|nr:cobalamin biosynthesis protein [Novosphingobium rosa]